MEWRSRPGLPGRSSTQKSLSYAVQSDSKKRSGSPCSPPLLSPCYQMLIDPCKQRITSSRFSLFLSYPLLAKVKSRGRLNSSRSSQNKNHFFRPLLQRLIFSSTQDDTILLPRSPRARIEITQRDSILCSPLFFLAAFHEHELDSARAQSGPI